MTTVRYIFHVFSVSAAVALMLASLPVDAFAQGQGETNVTRVGIVPIGWDDVSEDEKLELAKSGMRQFLAEIVHELISPTNLVVSPSQSNQLTNDEVAVRTKAFEKLAYIKNPGTVRVIAPFLSDTADPPSKPTEARHVSYAEMAADALSQIVSNPPPTANFSAQDKIRVWQQWWEQNKDKYP